LSGSQSDPEVRFREHCKEFYIQKLGDKTFRYFRTLQTNQYIFVEVINVLLRLENAPFHRQSLRRDGSSQCLNQRQRKWQETAGKVHNEELHNVYWLPNIRMMKLNDGKVGGECGMHRLLKSVLIGKPKGKRPIKGPV